MMKLSMLLKLLVLLSELGTGTTEERVVGASGFGTLLTTGGVTSVTYPFLSTLGIMIFLVMTLTISGASMIVSAFWTGRWGGFLLQILAGLFYCVSGFIIADRPIAKRL